MSKDYQYDYPRAGLTADCAVFRDIGFNEYQVLLIKRRNAPYAEFYATPGGYVEALSERIHEAAIRELKEETGLDVSVSQLRFINYYDAVDRHPNDRVVTFAFAVLLSGNQEVVVGDDALDYKWFDVNNLPKIAFDHSKIISDSLSVIKRVHYT